MSSRILPTTTVGQERISTVSFIPAYMSCFLARKAGTYKFVMLNMLIFSDSIYMKGTKKYIYIYIFSCAAYDAGHVMMTKKVKEDLFHKT